MLAGIVGAELLIGSALAYMSTNNSITGAYHLTPVSGGNGPTGPTGPTGPAGPAPAGSPPQVVGYSVANTPEAETISNDCTFTRTGANAYSITCTTAGGGTGTFGVGSLGVGIGADGVAGDVLATGGISLGSTSAGAGSAGAGNIVMDGFITCNNTGNLPGSCLSFNSAGTVVPVFSVNTAPQLVFGASTGFAQLFRTSAGFAQIFINGSTTMMTINGAGFSIGADNSVNSMAREPLHFGTGTLSSLVTSTNFDCQLIVKAITIENGTGTSIVDTSCTGGSTLKVFDCGTSAPANAACSGGTAKVTVTLSTTAGTAVAATVNSAAVAAGHYLCGQITTAGSGCTALDASLDVMARPQ